MAVFCALVDLLTADNPKLVPGVKKVKRYETIYRLRQGDYRVLFELHPGELTYLKSIYKGTLHVVAVLRRDKAYE